MAEQIWGNSANTIKYHVNGVLPTKIPHSQEAFSAAYAAFASGSASLSQAASSIGKFYGQKESPGNDLKETYGTMYTRAAQELYSRYADMLHTDNYNRVHNRLEQLYHQARKNPKEWPAYNQAYQNFVRDYGNG